MRKYAIIMAILAVGVGLTLALAQPPGAPPPPPPPGGTMGPPPDGSMEPHPGDFLQSMGPERRPMWEKFSREHPDDARTILDMIQKYPDLRMILGIGGPPGGPGGLRGHLGRMERAEQRNPEEAERVKKIFQLRQQARSLGEKYNHTRDAKEKKKIDGELRALLGQVYDLRLVEMKSRVQGVENRLAEVKEDLNKFEKDRNGVVESWFKQLTGKEDYKAF